MLLVSVNAALVAITHAPELEVTAEENHRIAVAAANVAKYYNVNVDPRVQAWMALIGVVGQVYGTRAVAIYMRP
ncbi:MAG TPA: hypothetical protein VIY48_08055, partial [Candidatus Paceibacterota bacterium]